MLQDCYIHRPPLPAEAAGGINERKKGMIEELRFKFFKRTLELYIQRLEKATTKCYDNELADWLHHLTAIHELMTNRKQNGE